MENNSDPAKTKAVLNKSIEDKNTSIDRSVKAKYLGVIIDNKLKFASHDNNVAKNSKGSEFDLHILINQHSPIPLTTKLHINIKPTKL